MSQCVDSEETTPLLRDDDASRWVQSSVTMKQPREAKLVWFEGEAACFIYQSVSTISCHTVRNPKVNMTATGGDPSALCILPCSSAVLVRMTRIVPQYCNIENHFLMTLFFFFLRVKHYKVKNVLSHRVHNCHHITVAIFGKGLACFHTYFFPMRVVV